MKHLALIIAIGLPACSSPPKPIPMEKQPEDIVRKLSLKPDDVRRVRTGEFVKTYHVGRQVTGRNDRVMREAHRVYRLEKPSRWNLARDQPPLTSTGPVHQLIDSAFKPAPVSAEIRAELNHQRTLTEKLKAAQNCLEALSGEAQAKMLDSVDQTGEVARLRDEIVTLQKENQRLQRVPPPKSHPTESGSVEALQAWGDQVEP